jgi:hypothetical protein
MTDRARLPEKQRREDSTVLALEEDDLRAQDGIMVRDLRTNERFWMHDAIIDEYGPLLFADTFTIYSSLCCMANREQYCWPSLARLARHWGKGKGTVVRAITLLTDLRLIHSFSALDVDGGNSNNIYYLLEPPPLDEGLMHLVTVLQGRGASPEQAAEQVLALLPQQWEPLRRKKSHLRTRADWLSLIEKHLSKDPSLELRRRSAPVAPDGAIARVGRQ